MIQLGRANKDQSTKTEDRLKSDCVRFESHKFSGGCVERATPVPIPNTEVKPLGADGTARATAWESRKPPGLFLRFQMSNLRSQKARERNLAGFFVDDLTFANFIIQPCCLFRRDSKKRNSRFLSLSEAFNAGSLEEPRIAWRSVEGIPKGKIHRLSVSVISGSGAFSSRRHKPLEDSNRFRAFIVGGQANCSTDCAIGPTGE
jgi:hypothetical protein